MTRGCLLGKPISLSDSAHGNRVVDEYLAGVERLAIEFEQSRIFHFGFEHFHGSRRREAFRLFEKRPRSL